MFARILLVEDETNLAVGIKNELEASKYAVKLVGDGKRGIALAEEEAFDLVISDWKLPGLSGLDLVRQLHLAKPRLPIILMTAYGTSETAIEASKLGAIEFVRKPFEMDDLLKKVVQSLSIGQERADRAGLGPCESIPGTMIGNSSVMQVLYRKIGQAAPTQIPVLIRGETGTGKELVARALHQFSQPARANGPFVAVNCTALPEALLESELFGHEKGAFTGAEKQHIGRFEHANGGTLFLDEIGDLTLGSQVKLLRVLQENYIQRVGSNEKIPVDVRVISATHRDIETAIRENRFREDLFYRINGVPIIVPPLRDRSEDIPDLARHFLGAAAKQIGVRDPFLDMTALEFLRQQPWPGNVRQLANVLRHAVLLAGERAITVNHVKEAIAHTENEMSTDSRALKSYVAERLSQAVQENKQNVHAQVLEELERVLFTEAFRVFRGNQTQAARLLGVTRTTFHDKLIRFGLLTRNDSPPAKLPGISDSGSGN